jgi:hypothetical protein
MAPRPKGRHLGSMQGLPDRRRGQPPLVQSEQLSLDQLGTEAATLPQVEDQRFHFCIELRGRRPVRPAAAGNQPVCATDPVTSPPLPEGGTGDTAPAAHLSGVTALSV